MQSLRKRGKEKLRLRKMSPKISNKDYKYFKSLFLECIKENEDIANSLNEIYRRIQVFFFNDRKERNVGEAVKDFLNLTIIPNYTDSKPATVTSYDNLGCILFFIQHMNEYTSKRNDIKDIREYHKNGIFEELCHLVEQKGDSSALAKSANDLLRLYYKLLGDLWIDKGYEIIKNLDQHRNHYEVYLMVMKAYPKSWFERYKRFYEGESDPIKYEENYTGWKKTFTKEIAVARLITDYIKNLAFMFVIKKFPREILSDEEEKKLDNTISMGRMNHESKKDILLIEIPLAESEIKSIDESIYETPEIFFNFIVDFWKLYKLVL